MQEVSDYHLSYIPGILKGYSRRSIEGELFPAISPNDDGCVNGVVYRDVPKSAWDRLDQFEGEMYIRQAVRVELIDGSSLLASTYIIREMFLDRLEQSDWDFAEFLVNGKASFQKHYKGYKVL
jgi:hypothetical protein